MTVKFPINNLRQNIDGSWNQQKITETYTIPSTAPYVIKLNEVPDYGTVNSRPIITKLAETLIYPPAAGYFYINYGNGHIAFDASDANANYDITYWKKGSLIESDDINWLYHHIPQNTTLIKIIDHIESGSNFFLNSNGTNYIKEGDDGNLGLTSNEFLTNEKYQIFLNGGNIIKEDHVIWTTPISFNFNFSVDNRDFIKIIT